MDFYKITILSHIIDYLKLKNYKFIAKGNVINLMCPFCFDKSLTAQVVAQTYKIKCLNPKCPRKGEKFTLISIVKRIEVDKKDWENEKIIQYIKNLFKVKTLTSKDEEEINKWFTLFENLEFSLTPAVYNTKEISIEKDWQLKEHKDKKEWLDWIRNGLNVAINCAKSKLTVIDFDSKPIPEEIKKLIGNPLMQATKRGIHCFYKKVEGLPKTAIGEFIIIDKDNKEYIIKNPNYPIKFNNRNSTIRKPEIGDKFIIKLNDEEKEVTLKSCIKIDIETNEGGIIIFPSIVEGISRKFINENPIIEMPKGLKDYLLSKIQTPSPTKTLSETLKQEIETENYKKPLVEEGEGRHELLFHYGCILRKQMNNVQVETSLLSLNKIICSPPVEYKEIKNIIKSVQDYNFFDEKEMANLMLQYLKEVKRATKNEIEMYILSQRAKGEDRKRIDKTLIYLEVEGLIIRRQRYYEIIEAMEWKDTLLDIGIPIDFKIPYLDDVAYYNKGDLIIIGSKNKWGKTTLAINMVKALVEQGIKPYYIYNEGGGRFGKIALSIGLKEGDFYRIFCGDPQKVILQPKAITIYDWVRPPLDEFAKTSEIFNSFTEKLEKTQGFLICFVQLKEGKEFFAPNMIGQFPSLLCKYLYEDDSDGTNTYFDICDVRDSKIKGKKFKIPCIYNWDTKLVKRTDEKITEISVGETILKSENEEE